MPEVTKHDPGTLCWSDLASPDVNAAKKFYGELLGWTYRDDPMGEGKFYTTCLVGGKAACAMYGRDANQPGPPAAWVTYISVQSADAAAQKTEKLGGKVAMPPFDVIDVGRMAMLADPTGAYLAAWEGKKHVGANVSGEPGSLVWTELLTPNVDTARSF